MATGRGPNTELQSQENRYQGAARTAHLQARPDPGVPVHPQVQRRAPGRTGQPRGGVRHPGHHGTHHGDPQPPVGSPFRDVQWFTRDDLWRLNRDGQLLPLLSGGLESILGLYERGAPPGLSWDLDVRLAMLRSQIPEVGGGRQETRPIREGLLAKWAQLDRAYADLRADEGLAAWPSCPAAGRMK